MFENDNFSTNWELENLNFHSTRVLSTTKGKFSNAFSFTTKADISW